MTGHDDPKANRLLAALDDTDRRQLAPHMRCLEVGPGQVLHAPGLTQRHAWFPTTSVISKHCLLSSGSATEIAMVGSEGMAGMSMVLGTDTSNRCSEVLFAGHGFRIEAEAIRGLFQRSPSARRVLLIGVQAFMTQLAQAAICTRFHTIEQQLCGFLLHTLDRLPGTDVRITQDHLAAMLGVRRESVTAALGRLRAGGLVRLSRGHVEVLDGARLEHHACECHAIVRKEHERLWRQLRPPASPPCPGVAPGDHRRSMR